MTSSRTGWKYLWLSTLKFETQTGFLLRGETNWGPTDRALFLHSNTILAWLTIVSDYTNLQQLSKFIALRNMNFNSSAALIWTKRHKATTILLVHVEPARYKNNKPQKLQKGLLVFIHLIWTIFAWLDIQLNRVLLQVTSHLSTTLAASLNMLYRETYMFTVTRQIACTNSFSLCRTHEAALMNTSQKSGWTFCSSKSGQNSCFW